MSRASHAARSSARALVSQGSRELAGKKFANGPISLTSRIPENALVDSFITVLSETPTGSSEVIWLDEVSASKLLAVSTSTLVTIARDLGWQSRQTKYTDSRGLTRKRFCYRQADIEAHPLFRVDMTTQPIPESVPQVAPEVLSLPESLERHDELPESTGTQERWLNKHEVAEILGVSVNTARKLKQNAGLTTKPGPIGAFGQRENLFLEADIEAYLYSRGDARERGLRGAATRAANKLAAIESGVLPAAEPPTQKVPELPTQALVEEQTGLLERIRELENNVQNCMQFLNILADERNGKRAVDIVSAAQTRTLTITLSGDESVLALLKNI